MKYLIINIVILLLFSSQTPRIDNVPLRFSDTISTELGTRIIELNRLRVEEAKQDVRFTELKIALDTLPPLKP